jgi:hypothetical protein
LAIRHDESWRAKAATSRRTPKSEVRGGDGVIIHDLNLINLHSYHRPNPTSASTAPAFSVGLLRKLSQVCSELVADSPEFCQPSLFWALYGGRIFKAPVKALGRGGENRATLLGVVTDGDDVIKLLAGKFLDGLGPVTGNVNPGLPHDLDGFRTHMARVGPRTKDFIFRPAVVPQQAFRHLAASRIARTKDQDAFPISHEVFSTSIQAYGGHFWPSSGSSLGRLFQDAYPRVAHTSTLMFTPTNAVASRQMGSQT